VFVFFLKVQNTQCGYHHDLSSLMDPLVLNEEVETGRLTQDRELLRLTSPLTKGWPRKWPLARQMWDSKPLTWDQIKKLMDMTTKVTGCLGMAGSPTATLLVALVIITIQLGAVQGNAYWTFMLNPPMVQPITW
jgi:hypothetical protein